MRRVLHILAKTDDPVAQPIIRNQKNDPQMEVLTVALSDEQMDYNDLLDKIFAADSVECW